MISSITNWTIWPLFLVLGTTALAIYTVALAMLGDRFEGPEAPVQLDAVAPEGHHRRRRVERRHEPRRLAGGSGGQLRFLDEEDVGPAGQREVIRHAAAGDPATDHDDTCLVPAHGLLRYLSGRPRSPRPPPSPVS